MRFEWEGRVFWSVIVGFLWSFPMIQHAINVGVLGMTHHHLKEHFHEIWRSRKGVGYKLGLSDPSQWSSTPKIVIGVPWMNYHPSGHYKKGQSQGFLVIMTWHYWIINSFSLFFLFCQDPRHTYLLMSTISLISNVQKWKIFRSSWI
jgi:hypothetical protein